MIISSIWPDIRLFSVSKSNFQQVKSSIRRIPDTKKAGLSGHPDIQCIPNYNSAIKNMLGAKISDPERNF
jgi:hypothetical protein